MDSEAKKAVANQIAAAMSAKDFAALERLMAPEFGAGFIASFRGLLTAFPDYHGANVEQVCEGDTVASRWVFYGTHMGEFMGLAPTGREVTFRGISFDRIVDGRLVAAEIVLNLHEVREQLTAELPQLVT